MYLEMKKAKREKQAAARKQQKLSKEKLLKHTEEPISPKDGVPAVSLDEHEATVSEIKAESVETLETNAMMHGQISSENETNPAEQWLSFNEVDTEIINKHISSQELVAVAYDVMTTARNWKNRAFHALPMFLLPVLSYATWLHHSNEVNKHMWRINQHSTCFVDFMILKILGWAGNNLLYF